MNIQTLQDFVTIEDNRATTDSRKVAQHYGRRHKDVLRSIGKMLGSKLPEIAEFARRNFALSFEINGLANGRRDKFYTMTKDGFLELAMSFTGDEARLTRIRFIEAFNAMADFIRNGLWQRRMDAEAAYRAGASQASVAGRSLRQWRDDKPRRLQVIADLDDQMQLTLPLH